MYKSLDYYWIATGYTGLYKERIEERRGEKKKQKHIQ
tara:strand:- start:1 stop:111 length:111 start_codon:yes stop_codon:yes gene_type:complete